MPKFILKVPNFTGNDLMQTEHNRTKLSLGLGGGGRGLRRTGWGGAGGRGVGGGGGSGMRQYNNNRRTLLRGNFLHPLTGVCRTKMPTLPEGWKLVLAARLSKTNIMQATFFLVIR